MNAEPPNTARAIAKAVRAGLDARAPVAAALARVARLNPGLNALCYIMPDTEEQAAELQKRLARAEPLPLAGVPVVIKDNIWVKGAPITQGSRLYQHFHAPQDAHAVARLRHAGAVVLGIATCSEFACKGVTNTPLHGVTHHPANPALTPGGSSGGPAAAVASGMVPVALGTDAGGSSRRPPAHVGIVGFKPGQDVIPYGPGFAEPSHGVSVMAPMAGSVADAALMFRALSQAPFPAAPSVSQLRIGFAPSMGLPLPVDEGVTSAIMAALDCLRSNGLTVTQASPEWPDGADPAGVMPIQTAGLAYLFGARWRSEPELFDPDIGQQIETGLGLSGADVAKALAASAGMRAALRNYLQNFDLILSPTSSTLAWPHGQLGPSEIGGQPASPRDHAAFTPQFNHAGLPALSLPCGAALGPHGLLPVGLHIGGGQGQEATVLAAAERFEQLFHHAGLWSAQPGN